MFNVHSSRQFRLICACPVKYNKLLLSNFRVSGASGRIEFVWIDNFIFLRVTFLCKQKPRLTLHFCDYCSGKFSLSVSSSTNQGGFFKTNLRLYTPARINLSAKQLYTSRVFFCRDDRITLQKYFKNGFYVFTVLILWNHRSRASPNIQISRDDKINTRRTRYNLNFALSVS